jgi:adenine-specific DNA-methyltransferase
VQTPPLYIQEKIHPKAIIEDLKRQAAANAEAKADVPDLFADFNGVPKSAAAEFYQHDQHWSNRMILGDSLSVMASLAERERLKGKVQCIYFDPPYGIKFNSNWQVSTQSRDVKDGKQTDISREPEQVKAFRDTWKDGIHSYLTYLRDRLTVMKDLLTDTGSIFVQIGDENVHRVRALMDEVFGEENLISEITFRKKTMPLGAKFLEGMHDYIIWFAKNKPQAKYRQLYQVQKLEDDAHWVDIELSDGTRRKKESEEREGLRPVPEGSRVYTLVSLHPPSFSAKDVYDFSFQGKIFRPRDGASWISNSDALTRLKYANRIERQGKTNLRYCYFLDDYPLKKIFSVWDDTIGSRNSIYVVQTSLNVVQRCILMTTDPGDLVLDPTCGSGTTAAVAEQWGRRWITIDTSRVALALARTRLMSARYPWYLLVDSLEGRRKEAELLGRLPSDTETMQNDLRQGFVYERVPHVTLKSIANNSRIDGIWEKSQSTLEPLRQALNTALQKTWEEWEIPRKAGANWSADATAAHTEWWNVRIARQKEIDATIAQAADVELLYDRPYSDNSRIRVAGPFTVESLSPHRIIAADDEELIENVNAAKGKRRRTDATKPQVDFSQIVIEYLKTSGIHQSDKGRKINFDSVMPWPGHWVGAEARFMEGDGDAAVMRRAAILIGPEYGTISRPDLTAAAREANEARFDVLIACAFNFDAHSSELTQLGPLPILKARMNPDLHMADELKNTGKGNLFVVFGEPDIDIETLDTGELRVKVNGVDVYDPNTGDIRSNDVKDIAAWFIDTDYNEESFFVRHAYFLGANDPYKALKTALRAEIDEDAWATLYSATSRPFARPRDGVIAVKVINHFGDEVMKVYRV